VKAHAQLRVESGARLDPRPVQALAHCDDAAPSPHFEDNYFDLVPGETKIVRVLGRHHAGRITARPWHSPHATTIDWLKPK
jgi:hypothetical protein